MSFVDKLARAVADLIEDAASEQPGERYGGTFAHRSPNKDHTFAAARAETRAEFKRQRASRQDYRNKASARAERDRQADHDKSPLGQASDAAWVAYLGTPPAQEAYASFGFMVARPQPTTEHFMLKETRPSSYASDDVQTVVSLDHGDRVSVIDPNPGWSSAYFGCAWVAADDPHDYVGADFDQWLIDGDRNLMALVLRPSSARRPLTANDLANFNRFLNGYDGGWRKLLSPGQHVTLLALRPDGRAVYDEMRGLFRGAWEARHA